MATKKTNIEYAADVLAEIKKMPAFEYSRDFAAIHKKFDEFEDFIDGIKTDIVDKDNIIIKLKKDIEELEILEDIPKEKEKSFTTIQCGIGTIDYDVNGGQWLEQIMETLGEKIHQYDVLAVIKHLQNF